MVRSAKIVLIYVAVSETALAIRKDVLCSGRGFGLNGSGNMSCYDIGRREYVATYKPILETTGTDKTLRIPKTL